MKCFKTTAKKDGNDKTKMFHISSPYFLHLFLPFFSQFSKCQTLKLFPSQADGCLQARWEGKDLLQWIHHLQKYVNQLPASAWTDPWLRLCGTQTHLFSEATKVYDAECFFVATSERNATATQKELLWWDGFYSTSLKQTVDQLREHCASWSYTRRGRKLIL